MSIKSLLICSLVTVFSSKSYGFGLDLGHKFEANSIRGFLQELSKEPHIAGSDRDNELVSWIESKFLEFGLDRVQRDGYKALLSYPDKAKPNKIHLLDDNSNVQFTSSHREVALGPEGDNPDLVDAFLAYTPPGRVEGDLVYANYGREEDLDALENIYGISVEGKIVIVRFGSGFRGNKVRSCQDRGAIGVIIFSDPDDVTLDDQQDPHDVYPFSRFLPGTGIQRGNTKVYVAGDPLSSGWASVENAFRLPLNESEGLPKIPAQPIGYDDARILIQALGGPEAPESWRGGIRGIIYRLGGLSNVGWKVRIDSNNIFDDSKMHQNVIGVIRGSEEPDRYVMVCNHRDAWGYGAVDPSSGTAVMLEVARVLGNEIQNGWRPKRSILFASWAAEEYGLLGSTEWVFHKLPKLQERTVALINIDQAVYGTFFSPSTSPSLSKLPIEASKLVSNPLNPSQSYFDYWKEMWNAGQTETTDPVSRLIGSGSDHDPFIFTAGIPAISMGFKNDLNAFPNIYSNPTYHTAYETFHLMDQILDPGFGFQEISAQMVSLMVTELTESQILNFDLHGLTKLMNESLSSMIADDTAQYLEDNNASLEHVISEVAKLDQSITDFNTFMLGQNLSNPLVCRRLNDQLMLLERVFVAEGGLPGGRSDARHLIYSPQRFNRYAGSAFPGIKDLLVEINKSTDPIDIQCKWKEMRRHLSDLMIALDQASAFLQDYDLI